MNSENNDEPQLDPLAQVQSDRFLITNSHDRTGKVSISSNFEDSKILHLEMKDYKEAIGQYLSHVTSMKIEKYERNLYKINKLYHKLKPGQVKLVDLIFTFPKMECESLSQDVRDSSQLQTVEKIMNENPNFSIKHKILDQVIHLVSCLAGKWKIFKIHKFLYRYNSRISFSKILNLEKINAACYNIDTFWLCVAAKENLIDEVANVEIYQASSILMEQFDKVLRMVLDEKIEKVKKIEEKKKFFGRCFEKCKREKKYSVSLEVPNFVMRMMKKNGKSFAMKIYKAIDELDQSYRFFEKALFGRFINILP